MKGSLIRYESQDAQIAIRYSVNGAIVSSPATQSRGWGGGGGEGGGGRLTKKQVEQHQLTTGLLLYPKTASGEETRLKRSPIITNSN